MKNSSPHGRELITLKSKFLAVGPRITPDSGCLVLFVKIPDWVDLITNLEVILL